MSGFAVLSGWSRRRRGLLTQCSVLATVALGLIVSLLPAAPASATAIGAARPAASVTKWDVQATPPIDEAEGLLAGISCPTLNTCFGVGNYLNHNADNVVEVMQWKAGEWSNEAAPSPPGSTSSELDSVSCASNSSCVAVGYSPSGALAEVWNGSAWKITPFPGSTPSPELLGVSCAGADFCLAVGLSDEDEGEVAIAYRWNGTKWGSVPVPSPKGAVDVEADSVSCVSPVKCEVVGSYESKTVQQAPFAAAWTGQSFKIQSVPVKSASTFSYLQGVSCTTDKCIAVGSYLSGSTVATLSESWSGTKWTLLNTPDPSGTDGSELVAVSCISNSSCAAVGWSRDGIQKSLAMQWNGTKWSLTPTPSSAASRSMSAVSCASADNCEAVGAGVTVESPSLNLAERWDGKGWTNQAIPTRRGYVGGTLGSVSCSTKSSCIAVGDAVSMAPVTERWNGSKWIFIASTGALGEANLAGVSCVSQTDCIVVGWLFSSQGIAGLWNGKRWKLLSTPGGSSNLTSVSCTSPTSCLSVGFSTDDQGSERAISESWNGKVWTRSSAVGPKAATFAQLNSVSCSDSDSCEAVGVWEDDSGTARPLVEHWNGKTWILQTSATVANLTLSAVSCPQRSNCLAVGYSFDRKGNPSNFSEQLDGGKWVSRQMPTPTGGAQTFGIDCPAEDDCVAVGEAGRAALAEGWNGSRWSLQDAAGPSGSKKSADLQAVSCAPSCTAVGYASSPGRLDPLVEDN